MATRELAASLLFAALAGGTGGQAQPAAHEVDRRVARASELIQRRAVSQAIALLEAAASDRPDDAEVHLSLGMALSLVPRRNEAVEALLRAIELGPNRPRVHAGAGAAFARLGETDAALQVLERAVSLDPDLGDAHLNLGLILAARGEFDRAAAHLASALRLETDRRKLARLHFLNGKLFAERGRTQQAAREFERSTDLDPQSGDAFLALGLARKGLLLEDEAHSLFLKAVDLDPGSPDAHYHLAQELQRRGDHANAAAHFLRAHDLRPDDQSILYNLTRSLHKAGRRSESLKYRRELARMIGASDKARQNEIETARLHAEAVRLDEAGQHAEALDKYRDVLEIEPLNAVARRNLALVLCRLGRWREGIEELEAILRHDPDDADTARALVIVLDQARQSEADANPAAERPR